MVRLPRTTAAGLAEQARRRGVSSSDLAGELIAAGLAGTATADRIAARPTDARTRTAVDLFSGAGGFGLGLSGAGCGLRLAFEQDAAAAAAHTANLPGTVLTDDIRDVADARLLDAVGTEVGELDILVAGPPCQGFSVIGSRVVLDPRNSLMGEVLRAVRALRPRAVVIENVLGMVTMAGGGYLRTVLQGLADAGYDAACAQMLAAQHGTPQLRWRLVVIAWRSDVGVPAGHGFPEPTHGAGVIGDLVPNCRVDPTLLDGMLTLRDAIGYLPPVQPGGQAAVHRTRPSRAFQAIARTGPDGRRMHGGTLRDHDCSRLGPDVAARVRLLRPGQDWRDLPVELLEPSTLRASRGSHTSRYRRMEWDAVPRMVITNMRDPKSGAYIHPSQDRTISLREGARIQSFPDWWQFVGGAGDRARQIGNAIPPALAQAIGEEIAACLAGTPRAERLADPFRRGGPTFLDRHGQLAA